MAFLNGTDPGLRQIRAATTDNFAAGVDFTAGSSTQVTLTNDPGSEDNVIITFDGVTQHRNTYTVSGAVVTFDAAIGSGVSNVEATYTTTIPAATPADNSVTLAKLSDGTQGGLIYYGGSGAPTELAAGTSGQFLQTLGAGSNPQWAAASGDFVLLATNTPSAASTSDFTAFDNATYNSYLFIFTNIVTSSDGSHFICKTSTDGGSTYDTGYAHANFQNNTNTGSGVTDTEAEGAGSVELTATNNWGSATNEQLAGELRLYNPGATAHCKMTWQIGYDDDQAGAYWTCEVGAAKRETAADVDAIQFLSSSGTITGTIKMYGLK